jgi:hypothetical protein
LSVGTKARPEDVTKSEKTGESASTLTEAPNVTLEGAFKYCENLVRCVLYIVFAYSFPN